jgi:hypothetical protein
MKSQRTWCALTLAVLTGLVSGAFPSVIAQASTTPVLYVAQGGADTGSCSSTNPCATVSYALTQSGPNATIEISGTINDHVTINTPVTISGADAPAGAPALLNGMSNGTGSVVSVRTGARVTLENLGITGGQSIWRATGQCGCGGGIFNQGRLVLSDVNVSGNLASFTGSGGPGIQGGGIDNQGGSLAMTNSSVTNNTASGGVLALGGGIYINGGSVNINDSTISGNASTHDGGGIYSEGGGAVTITDSTITANNAQTHFGVYGYGGGLSLNGGSLALTADTIAGNTAPTSDGGGISNYNGGSIDMGATIVAENNGGNCQGAANSVVDNGHNLTSDLIGGACGFSRSRDLINRNPDLDSLAGNGGPTQTMLPSPSSPAANAIPSGTTLNGVSVCPGTDQRGVARPLSGQTSCAIGAVEPFLQTTPDAPLIGNAVAGGSDAVIAFTAPNSDGGSPILSYTVTATDQTSAGNGLQTAVGSSSPITVAGLTPGDTYTFTVTATNAIGTGPSSTPSNAVVPHPVVTSISSGSVGQGAANVPVIITGAGFTAGAKATLSEAGATIGSIVVVNSTSIFARLSVAATTPVGPENLTVTDAFGSGTCSGCLSVYTAPAVTAVSPPAFAAGAKGQVVFNGSSFQPGAKLSVLGAAIKVTATSVTPTAITATLSVPTTAAIGSNGVKVTNLDHGTSTCAACFTVIAAPTLTSISPSTASPGSVTPVTLTGTGFGAGANVSGPAGVSFAGVTVVNSTSIVAIMTVAATASPGSSLPITVSNNSTAGYGTVTAGILTVS